jgi:FdhE protein
MMMTFDHIKKTRPHLIESLDLYERVLAFEERVRVLARGRINTDHGAYPADLVDVIIDEFSLNLNISADILSPIKEAMRFRQIDFFRLPLNELPSFSFPYLEEEIEEILFILSRPFFFYLRQASSQKDILTDKGRCPVCQSTPVLSSIHENEARLYYCSFCGNHGRWSRIGCPACQNRRGEEIEIITAEQEKGLRLELCLNCKNYVKTFDREIFRDYTPELIDIMSMPFDIIAQQKGFIRSSPNPIGLRRFPLTRSPEVQEG